MNSTNETFHTLDHWFSLYGYPYTNDILVGCVMTPAWLLSLLLSIFSLAILLKAPLLASYFFSYIRLYVTNCIILSALSLTTILAFTRRFFSIANTSGVAYYAIYGLFVLNSLFLFSSCIEICLVAERILYMLPRGFRRIKMINFNQFFFILFIICFFINLPGVFLFEPAFADIKLDPNTPYRIWYIRPTNFSFCLTGRILNYLGYIFRDILPMALKIIFNSLSIYLVGKYFKNKKSVREASTTTHSHLMNIDHKQTYVALAMNTLSVLEHSLYISSYILYFVLNYDLADLLYALALLFIAVKHLLVFFVLLLFNSMFRVEVKYFFR